MAKNKNVEVVGPSYWDGGVLAYLGSWILRLIVLGVFLFAGWTVATMNIVGNGVPFMKDILDNPLLILYVAAGGALCGIGVCWFFIIGLKYDIKHRVINGQRLRFTASTWNLFWNCVKWVIFSLSVVYLLWLLPSMKKWACKYTTSIPEIEEDDDEHKDLIQYPITYYTVDDDGNYEQLVVEDDI